MFNASWRTPVMGARSVPSRPLNSYVVEIGELSGNQLKPKSVNK